MELSSEMIFAVWILIFIVSTIVVTFHMTALKQTERIILHIGFTKIWNRRLISTTYILLVHWIEIIIYGCLYYILVELMNVGNIVGTTAVRDYFYFSATSYTSLGFGDLYPTGEIRILAGIEALVGLIMIGWTAVFTFNQISESE